MLISYNLVYNGTEMMKFSRPGKYVYRFLVQKNGCRIHKSKEIQRISLPEAVLCVQRG